MIELRFVCDVFVFFLCDLSVISARVARILGSWSAARLLDYACGKSVAFKFLGQNAVDSVQMLPLGFINSALASLPHRVSERFCEMRVESTHTYCGIVSVSNQHPVLVCLLKCAQ